MSKKEIETNNIEQKVMTKYDLKMQRRKEEKEKEKKEKLTGTIIGVLVVIALAAWVISLPVRNYNTLNGTYITVADQKITKVEYDYHYYQVKANYIAQYGSILTNYMGIDTTSDFSKEMYSQTMTWGDFFDEMTVASIKRTKALEAEAKKAGFTYDPTEEYTELNEHIKEAASDLGITVNAYLKEYYGPYATTGRIEKLLKDNMVATAYYNQVLEEKAPSEEDMEAYYEENKDSYDVVDYKITTITAELPTEPTELADPVDEDAGETTEEETAYKPSEAEIAKAMADAKVLAEEAKDTVEKEGTVVECISKARVNSVLSDWLFDSSRKKGDITVIEDTSGNRYYTLAFQKRYRDETPSADVRVVMLENQDPQPIYDEWKNGEATEESFAALCDKYSQDTSADGGFYEMIPKTGMQDNLADWLFDKARKKGDTEIIEINDMYTYIVYYVAPNMPEWKISIKNTLTQTVMDEYLQEISENITVNDPKGNLKYIEIRAKEAADAEAAAAAEESESAKEAE